VALVPLSPTRLRRRGVLFATPDRLCSPEHAASWTPTTRGVTRFHLEQENGLGELCRGCARNKWLQKTLGRFDYVEQALMRARRKNRARLHGWCPASTISAAVMTAHARV
jgi:hypothetical protein